MTFFLAVFSLYEPCKLQTQLQPAKKYASWAVLIHTRKTAGTAENPAANKLPFVTYIQIKLVISRKQIYAYHTDLLLLKIWVTLTLASQGQTW